MTWEYRRSTLESTLKNVPTNIEHAEALWNHLGLKGHDVRSGYLLLDTFRSCALHSSNGVIALARAYKQLAKDTGEYPNVQLFDNDLIAAIRNATDRSDGQDKDLLQWLMAQLEG